MYSIICIFTYNTSYNILKIYLCVSHTNTFTSFVACANIPDLALHTDESSNACSQVSSHRNNVHPSVASSLAFSALLAATLGRFEGP